METLKNKVILVTGGTRGIGRSIVESCINEGATVVFTYVSKHSESIASELEQRHNTQKTICKGFRSSASSFKESSELIENIIQEFKTIDVLINNAGITRDNLILRMSEQQWDEIMDTNLKSVFNLTKNTVKYMMKAKKGSIINMSSVVGVMGNAGQTNYSASKAGLIGFSKSLAKELGSRNIRCNAIAPGFIQTDMVEELNQEQVKEWSKNIPLKRLGNTEDISNLCIFLASDKSTYITGQVINVCGGMCI